MKAIYKKLCGAIKNQQFVDFMLDERSIAVRYPAFPAYQTNKELTADMHNIRIMKFAITHFQMVYEACSDFLATEDKNLVESIFHSLWASVMGLAVDYKKNRLAYKDRELFANYADVSQI